MGSRIVRLHSSTVDELEKIKQELAQKLGGWPTHEQLAKELERRLKK